MSFCGFCVAHLDWQRIVGRGRVNRNAAAESPPGRQVARRYIHLDLKGAPPRPSYLIQLFTFVAEWGASGLLIEWEDVRTSPRILSSNEALCTRISSR